MRGAGATAEVAVEDRRRPLTDTASTVTDVIVGCKVETYPLGSLSLTLSARFFLE